MIELAVAAKAQVIVTHNVAVPRVPAEGSRWLSIAALLEGWMKLTRAALPMLKVCQSIAARLLLWVTVIVAPAGLTLLAMLA